MIEHMPTGSAARNDFSVLLSHLTGRKLGLDDVLAAVEMSRSTFYDRQAKGTLTSTDTLLTAARNLGLNPIDLLVRYGHIAASDVTEYIQDSGGVGTVSGAAVGVPAPLDERRSGCARLTEPQARSDVSHP
jgi:hypothetical protein